MLFKIKSYINIPMLLRVIGWLLLIEAGFMIIPLITSIIYNEQDYISFVISIGITLISGIIMTGIKPKNREMGKREAILLTASIWIFFSLFAMIPFLISKTHHSITNAFFESISGFTTTGMSVLNTLENVPKGILMWRCVMQWIGGMGIILFTLAVLPMLNYQGGMQLFNAEVTGITHDKLRPRVSSTAKGLWLVYFILTLLLIVLLSFSDMTIFDAICHGFSTMSTGGFSTVDNGLMQWNTPYIKIVISVFMFLGGVNFAVLYNILTYKLQSVKANDSLKWYALIILFASIILSINIVISGNANNFTDYVLNPIFQSIAIISSTGITEPNVSNWGEISICVLTFLTFIGACAGSTSGGAKIDRIIILFKFIKNEFYKMMHPNAVMTVRMNGKGTTTIIVQKAIAFLFLYILTIIIGGIILTVLGLPISSSFFYSLHAISNTGVTLDFLTDFDTQNIAGDAIKWTLSFIMLVGRLELYTVLLLFTSSFWKK